MDITKSKIMELINSNYPELTKNEIIIASYVKKNFNTISNLSVTELANLCEVGETTVFRFVKKLGYSGFPDFKLAVAREIAVVEELALTTDETNKAIKLKNRIVKQLERSCRDVDENHVLEVAKMIKTSRRVVIMGVGSSGINAKFLEDRFIRLGFLVKYIDDTHQQKMVAAALTNKDLIIFVSISGNTKELVETSKVAKENNCKIVSITSYPKSPLALNSDVILNTISRVDLVQSGSLYNSITQLFMIEYLTGIFYQYYKNEIDENKSKVANANLSVFYDKNQI